MIKIKEDGKEYYVRADLVSVYQDQKSRDIFYDVSIYAYEKEFCIGNGRVLETYTVSLRTGKVCEDYEDIEPRPMPFRECITYANGRNFDYDQSKTLWEYAEWYYMQKRGKEKKSKERHFWHGKVKPGHLENIKEWQLSVGDTLENILVEAFGKIAIETGIGEVSEEADYHDMAKKVFPVIMETARDGGIPVWDPEADSYIF